MVPCLEQQFSDHLIRYFPKIFLLFLIATRRACNTVVSISQFAHEHFFQTLYSLVDIRADDQKLFFITREQNFNLRTISEPDTTASHCVSCMEVKSEWNRLTLG